MSEASSRRRVRRNRKNNSSSENLLQGSADNVGSGEEKGDERAVGVGQQAKDASGDKASTNVQFKDSQAAGGDSVAEQKTATPRVSSPKKPNKPPKTPAANNREDDKDAVDRSRGKILPDTIYNAYVLKYFPAQAKAGYRLGLQSRGTAADSSILGPGDAQRYLQVSIPVLRMDTTSMVRPAVRMHAVYKDSGMYIKSPKIAPAAPCTTMHASITDKTQVTWTEQLQLKAYLKDIAVEDALILFEILDDRPSLKANTASAGTRRMKRLGWAFLIPMGENGHVNVGRTEVSGSSTSPRGRRAKVAGGGTEEEGADSTPKQKDVVLQVFENVDNDGLVGSLQRAAMGWPSPQLDGEKDEDAFSNDGIPGVYLQWRLSEYTPVPNGRMHVTTVPCDPQAGKTVATALPINKSPEALKAIGEQAEVKKDAKSEKLAHKAKSNAIKRLRGRNEPCVVPDKLLHRLVPGPNGACALKYSHNGNFLAVAAGTALPPLHVSGSALMGDVYSVAIYDSDNGVECWRENTAHHGVIYDLQFSLDDNYLVSCSGDGCVKVWSLSTVSHNLEASLHHTLTTSPPVYLYSVVFQEFALSAASSNSDGSLIKKIAPVPPIIAGASDGRLRVWNDGKFSGYISVDEKDDLKHAHEPVAHVNARIHALTIDRRSRYLLSGDSAGEIFVWRLDPEGWYQLLRRFKQEPAQLTLKGLEEEKVTRPQCCGISSIYMHPEIAKSQVLVMSQVPASLRLFSTSTYRALSQCSGLGGGMSVSTSNLKEQKLGGAGASFSRSVLSPDGSYAVTCTRAAEVQVGGDAYYRLKVWEAQTGHLYPSALTDIVMPFPARDVAWHPSQHTLAVACNGPGAAVMVYAGERESAELAVGRMQADATQDDLNSVTGVATAL